MQSSAQTVRIDRRAFLLVPLVGIAFAWLAGNRRPVYDIREVGIAEGKALFESGAVVVDVREADQYNHRHIAGAILLPLTILEVAIPASFAFAKATRILVYCGDGLAHGPKGTAILNKAGYANAVNLKPGIEGWVEAGLPMAA